MTSHTDQTPGAVAVARRRAILAETAFVSLLADDATIHTLIDAHTVMTDRFDQLEAAENAQHGPAGDLDAAVVWARRGFELERCAVLKTYNDRRGLVADRRIQAITAAAFWTWAGRQLAGVDPIDGDVLTHTASARDTWSSIFNDKWADLVATASQTAD